MSNEPIAPPAELPRPIDATSRERVGLELIAAFNILKAAGLVAAGFGALGLLNAGVAARVNDWLEDVALGKGHRLMTMFAERALPYLYRATGKHLIMIAVGAFLYAMVFLVEAWGLWRCRRWAEYLTLGVTLSYLPIEIIAFISKATPLRAAAVIMNGAVVWYLIWQLRRANRRRAELGAR